MKQLLFTTALRLTAISTVWTILSAPALATMPRLTDTPSSPTSAACEKWASEQDDDAIEMWSVQENDTWPREVGLNRLYLYCLGVEPPEIVGFGSSVGVNIGYCEKYPKFKICENEHR